MLNLLHSLSPYALLGSGALIGYARSFWSPVVRWIDRRLWISIETVEPDITYYELDAWINSCANSGKVRSFYLKSAETRGRDTLRLLVPGFGSNYFLYENRLVEIIRSKTESPGGASRQVQSIKIRCLFRGKQFIDHIVKEGRDRLASMKGERCDQVYAFNIDYREWVTISTHPRSIDSIHLPARAKDELLSLVSNFMEGDESYRHLGIPYGIGILLQGHPGTGKTSTVAALSNHFNIPVYFISLAQLNDNAFQAAMIKLSNIGMNAIVAIEDVDTFALDRKPGQSDRGVSLSLVLNVLDGFLRPHGCIFALTTNHPESLDPAIIRPGRIDLTLQFEYATHDQITSMFQRFFPNATTDETEQFVARYDGTDVTTGAVQVDLFERRRCSNVGTMPL